MMIYDLLSKVSNAGRARLKRNWKSPLRIIGFSFSSIKFEYFPVLLQIFERKHNALQLRRRIFSTGKMKHRKKENWTRKLISLEKKKVWIRKLKVKLCCFRPAVGWPHICSSLFSYYYRFTNILFVLRQLLQRPILQDNWQ